MTSISKRRNVGTATVLHPVVYGALVFFTLWILAAIWLFFGNTAYAMMQLAVSTFFGAMFLFTPLWLFWETRAPGLRSPELRDWADREFEIADGAIEARHAVAMILSAPAAVAIGITAIGAVARLAAIGAI